MKLGAKIAKKLAPKGQHRHFRMSAVVVKGGAILSSGVNKGWNHAEARALRKHHNYSGAVLYVARENGGCSRPCSSCMRKIELAGIVKIVYNSSIGNTVELSVTRNVT